MRDVGYRVRLEKEWVVEFISRYASLFNSVEIKLRAEEMKDIQVNDFVDFCNMRGIDRVSFHLPKRAFTNGEECAKVCEFMRSMKVSTDAILVTHFYGLSVDAENHGFAISNVANERCLTVAIENIDFAMNPFVYLEELKCFASSKGFKVCLDIPHLLFSAYYAGIWQEEVLDYFKMDEWWKRNIVEFHLHDFNSEHCHLNIGDGWIDFDVLRELLEYFSEASTLIIETTVQDIGIQGVAEVNNLLRRLKEHEDKSGFEVRRFV